MSYLSEFLDDGFTELSEFLGDSTGPQTITFNGAEIPCIPNALERGSILDIGGHFVEIAFKIFVQRSEFLTCDTTLITADSDEITCDSDLPLLCSGVKLSYKSKTYRVAHVRTFDSHLEVMLQDPNSGK